MPIETYSERKRRLEKGDGPDVYSYDQIPPALRQQILHVIGDGFSLIDREVRQTRWYVLQNQISRAEGQKNLGGFGNQMDCEMWLAGCTTDQVLDMVEIACNMILDDGGDEQIDEINHYFRKHGVGYRFEGSQIIRIDSQFVHSEVVKPAIDYLTSDVAFDVANKDFMLAHEHYRDGKNKDAVVAANRAFESTLKAICTKKGWPYAKNARATDLIKIVRQHGLFPDYLDNVFDNFIAAMKSGLPGIRNNAGGHGSAPGTSEVPEYIASYAIHLSAVNIILAIEASKE
jgi:AbiJ N-terminal domain 4/HEPN domain